MPRSTRLVLFAGVIMLAGLSFGSFAADVPGPGVRDSYKVPTLSVPYAWSKPVVDGVVDDAEWQGALSVNALQTTNGKVSARQTRWWMLWDEDGLYIAMRSPLREGERVMQANRGVRENGEVIFDDSYEIWLDMGTIDPNTGLVAFYQFLSNFAGSYLDVVQQPSVGNSSTAWTSGWQPKKPYDSRRQGMGDGGQGAEGEHPQKRSTGRWLPFRLPPGPQFQAPVGAELRRGVRSVQRGRVLVAVHAVEERAWLTPPFRGGSERPDLRRQADGVRQGEWKPQVELHFRRENLPGRGIRSEKRGACPGARSSRPGQAGQRGFPDKGGGRRWYGS